MEYLTETERGNRRRVQPSRDKRLILFLSNPRRPGEGYFPTYSTFVSKIDAEQDSDVDDGVPGQFADLPRPNGVIIRKVKGRYEDHLSFFERTLRNCTRVKIIPSPTLETQKSEPKFVCETCARFRRQNLWRQMVEIIPFSFYTLIQKQNCPIPMSMSSTKAKVRIIPCQFEDSESDKSEVEVKGTGKEEYVFPNYPLGPNINHHYYLALTKIFRQSTIRTPFAPFKDLGSLHVTKEEHIFFTSNQFAYNMSTMGSFWCIRNPLRGMKGCQVDLEEINNNLSPLSVNTRTWKLNHPNLDISGTNISTGRYPVPITIAIPMSNRMIFFGDEGGRVGVAWYYFIDEVDKYSYKISQENIGWTSRLQVGCFQVVATDKKFITNHNSKITAVDVFSKDGRSAVSGGSNGSVFVWSADILHVKNRFPKIASSGGTITCIKCSPNDLDCFVTASKSGSILLWDTRCTKPFELTYRLENNYLSSMAWHPHNVNCILGGSSTGDIVRFDIRRPKEFSLMIRPWNDAKAKDPISHLVFNPENPKHFAAASQTHIAHLNGLTSSSCEIFHRYSMNNSVSGLTFYRDKVFSVNNDCCLTGFKFK